MNSLKVILINMIVILMILAKLATPARYKIKVLTSQFLSMALTTKFHHMTQTIL